MMRKKPIAFKTVFGRAVSVALATVLATTYLFPLTAFAVAPEEPLFDDLELPTADEVDDSTESGKMLKAMLLYVEEGEGSDLGDGISEPTTDWGEGLDSEEWLLDETVAMVPVDMEIPASELGITDTDIASLEAEDIYVVDENGNIESSVLNGLIEAGLKGLISGSPDALVDWGISSLVSYMFGGDDSSDQIMKSLEEISAKLDEIKRQLDQVMIALQKVLDAQELSNLRADIARASAVRDTLKDTAALTRLNLSSAGRDAKTRQQQLDRFNATTVNGQNIYIATMELGNTMIRTNNQSGKDMFHVIDTVTKKSHFPWDHQYATFESNLNNYYMGTYLEMIGYCKVSLLWQIEKNKNNAAERDNYRNIYKMIFAGDAKAGVDNHVQNVLNAFAAAPKYLEKQKYSYYKDSGQYTFLFNRKTYISDAPAQPLELTMSSMYPNALRMTSHVLLNSGIDTSVPQASYLTKDRAEHFQKSWNTKNIAKVFSECGAIPIKSNVFFLEDNLYARKDLFGAGIIGKTIDGTTAVINSGDTEMIRFKGYGIPFKRMETVVTPCTFIVYGVEGGESGAADETTQPNGVLRGVVTEKGVMEFTLRPITEDDYTPPGNLSYSSQGTVTLDYDKFMKATSEEDGETTDVTPDLEADGVSIAEEDVPAALSDAEPFEVGDTVEVNYYSYGDGAPVNLIDGERLYTNEMTILSDDDGEHEPEGSYTGTISEISGDSMSIYTADGETVIMLINAKTVVVGVTNTGLQIGDRVEAEYWMKAADNGAVTMYACHITVLDDDEIIDPAPNPNPEDDSIDPVPNPTPDDDPIYDPAPAPSSDG